MITSLENVVINVLNFEGCLVSWKN